MAKDSEGRRNKKKDKYKEKKKHPYKSGGKNRTKSFKGKRKNEEEKKN